MKFFLKTSTILLCFLLFLSTDALAQKKSRKMIKADQAFSAEQYNKAAELYKKVYQKAKSRALKSEIIQGKCGRIDDSGKIYYCKFVLGDQEQ